MKYQTGVMSSKIEIEADNIDQAICVSMLYFNTTAPIAVYNTKEKNTLSFPYSSAEVDKILGEMGDKLRESYSSIVKLS